MFFFVKNPYTNLSVNEPKPVIYQLIAFLTGTGLYYAFPLTSSTLEIPLEGLSLIVGLVVSGGSGFWNDVVDLLNRK